MIALSIRQPWAWLILHAGKDIENRDWSTRVRGHVLVHAAKGCTVLEYESAVDFAHSQCGVDNFPSFEELRALRGGIVGSVEITGCVLASPSKWFAGKYGFTLRDPRPLPFTPWKGQLGFFDVPETSLVQTHATQENSHG